MKSQEFLKEVLKDWEKRFASIKLKYAYDALVEYHIIEVSPEEIRRGNADYKKAEIKLWNDFISHYPSEDLLICAPSQANDMSNVLFETK
jgi:predicted PolB exonuclease-like 3'-5' exonuclease